MQASILVSCQLNPTCGAASFGRRYQTRHEVGGEDIGSSLTAAKLHFSPIGYFWYSLHVQCPCLVNGTGEDEGTTRYDRFELDVFAVNVGRII